MIDFHLAYDLALHAQAVYNHGEIISGNARASVDHRLDRQIVSIAGTNDPKDLLDDLAVVPVYREYAKGLIGDGFADYFDLLRDPLLAVLDPHKLTFLDGHSLGGNGAKLCAKYLFDRGFRIGGVYTWGCPRVGADSFNRAFRAMGIPLFEFWHPRDIIPTQPRFFPRIDAGYCLEDGKILEKPHQNDFVLEAELVEELVTGFPHHSMALYCEDMRRLAA